MLFSGVFFAATLIIPFFDLSTKTKVVASTTNFVLMEVVFWLGGLLVGKELRVTSKNLIPETGSKRKRVTMATLKHKEGPQIFEAFH